MIQWAWMTWTHMLHVCIFNFSIHCVLWVDHEHSISDIWPWNQFGKGKRTCKTSNCIYKYLINRRFFVRRANQTRGRVYCKLFRSWVRVLSRELEIKIMSFNFHQLSLKFEQILSCQEHTGVSGQIRVGAHIRQSIETALQYWN